MTEVKPLYVTSMERFLSVYDAAILHSERYDNFHLYAAVTGSDRFIINE